jgi:chemotaxis protein histidine kinase CheA
MKQIFRNLIILLFLYGSSFAQGFAEQIKATQQQQKQQQAAQDAAQATVQQQVAQEDAAQAAALQQQAIQDSILAEQQKPQIYEEFFTGIEELAKGVLPEIQRMDSLKAIVNAETTEPKDEFEKQADYDVRIATFEKAKQQKFLEIEQEFRERTKESTERIKLSLSDKRELQPDWDGMLKKDADVEGYRERINKFNDKISDMKNRISQIGELLGSLQFNQKEAKSLQDNWLQKTSLYFSHLERACELMQDYIIQEQAKILTSEKSKIEMSLGSYDADKEEFEINMNDSASQTVPFDFSGTVKISPALAKETNRQTDNFTANVDYINYPFITGGATLYPGTKKARVYYNDQELPTNGNFKGIQRFYSADGYLEWALYADSLLSGKLSPKNLDSMYAMSTKGIKIAKSSGGSDFWTGKNIFRVVMFGLSATSIGLGIMQNSAANSESKKVYAAIKEEASAIKEYGENSPQHKAKHSDSKKKVDDFNFSANLRDGFYISAGVLGVAGAVSFFF